MNCVLAITAVICSSLLLNVDAHGRMNSPPGRSTAWRFNFNTPKNFNDHEVYCGGLGRLWDQNGGKCGVCGDPYDEPAPRDNEAGGKYGTGTIVRTYQQGQIIQVEIQLTANHRGHFEFRICPVNNRYVAATNECMDQYVLSTNQGIQYTVTDNVHLYTIPVQLPPTLTCTQCVFRWKYVAAQHVGQGIRQEHFYACADVAITSRGIVFPVETTRRPFVPQTTRPPFVPQTTRRPFVPFVPQTTRRPFVPETTRRPFVPFVPLTTRRPFVPPQEVPICDDGCRFMCSERLIKLQLCPPQCLPPNCRQI